MSNLTKHMPVLLTDIYLGSSNTVFHPIIKISTFRTLLHNTSINKSILSAGHT